MGRFIIGDVVVLNFPFSDLSGAKRRPALVISELAGDDIILCQITSSARTDGYAVKLENKDFTDGKLSVESVVRPNKIFTADESIIVYKACKISNDKINAVIQVIADIINANRKKTMILVSGMPGTGKTTFADYLAGRLDMPLVSYDKILVKERGITHSHEKIVSFDFFWFFCETIMKSDCPLIAEYIFSNHQSMREQLDALVSRYGYKTINIHFDADIEAAYKRVVERNKNSEGIIIDLDFETFSERVSQNRGFSFGERRIAVNTNDFSKISYDDIVEQTQRYMRTL